MFNLSWLFLFLLAYWAYCIFWGLHCSRNIGTISEYLIAGRNLSGWVFVMATTAVCFTGWVFIGQPELIAHRGFSFSQVSLYAITLPLAGVLFMKRQWLLGKHFGYLTQSEMVRDYFGGRAISLISVGIALFFAIPFVATQLSLSGYVISQVSGQAVSSSVAMWFLAAIMLLYVVLGGLRAVAHVGVVQLLLMVGGMLILGAIPLVLLGGFDAFNQTLGALATSADIWPTTEGLGGGNHNSYFTIPGVIQWTSGIGKEMPTGGPWTTVMSLTFALSFMGVLASPNLAMWGFANRSGKAFAIQQVWGCAFCFGLLLIFFSVIQGVGSSLLGSNEAVNTQGLALLKLLPSASESSSHLIIIDYIQAIDSKLPWLAALLAVCAVAAMQSTAAAFTCSSAGILVNDLYRPYQNPKANNTTQIIAARLFSLLLIISALLIATYAEDLMFILGGLAIAFSFQLLPTLFAVTRLPWITRQGATLGLIAGLIVTVMTETLGQEITRHSLPWGKWPWTIHSATWGMFFNVLLCVLVSLFTKNQTDQERQARFHNILRQNTLPTTIRQQRLKTLVWILVFAWFFFAIGPGAILGNALFGAPDGGYESWLLGMPSIWAWQLMGWMLGVGLIWLLANRMNPTSGAHVQ